MADALPDRRGAADDHAILQGGGHERRSEAVKRNSFVRYIGVNGRRDKTPFVGERRRISAVGAAERHKPTGDNGLVYRRLNEYGNYQHAQRGGRTDRRAREISDNYTIQAIV